MPRKKIVKKEVAIDVLDVVNKKWAEIGAELDKKFADINERLMRVERYYAEKQVVEEKKVEEKAKVETMTGLLPIPPDYRKLVDEILNQEFKIRLAQPSDSMSFQFTIIVPEQYSTMTPQMKQLYGEDIRPKVITYAEGINGVKEWCERVYSSFGIEMKAAITKDRKKT